jgi:hypothetical protein
VQSLTEQREQKELLERQINQLFSEVVSVWRESDIKKSQSVRILAARMEEYYLQLGQPQEIEAISQQISERLKQAGLANTAHHVSDYLEDKYKRNKSTTANPYQGIISGKYDIEQIIKTSPDLRSPEQIQDFHDYSKWIAVEAEANRTIAVQKHIALDSDSDYLSKPHDEKVSTDVPDNQYRGPVYEELERLVKDLESYHKDMKETLDDFGRWFDADKIPEKPFVKAIEQFRTYIKDVRCIIAPAKDLKYATSMHNWFHTCGKFLAHGKHAGGVMTSIPSSKHFRTLSDGTLAALMRALTREQVGDRIEYVYRLLISWAESKVFMSDLEAFLKQRGDWYRDDRLRDVKLKFVLAVIRIYADDGDFLNWLSYFREKTMDEEVAARRINARPKLSNLA